MRRCVLIATMACSTVGMVGCAGQGTPQQESRHSTCQQQESREYPALERIAKLTMGSEPHQLSRAGREQTGSPRATVQAALSQWDSRAVGVRFLKQRGWHPVPRGGVLLSEDEKFAAESSEFTAADQDSGIVVLHPSPGSSETTENRTALGRPRMPQSSESRISTISSLASPSSIARSASVLGARRGASSTARASKRVPPAIGASTTSVLSSTMLTSRVGEGGRDLRDDAGMVGAEQLELEPRDARSAGSVGALDVHLQPLLAQRAPGRRRARRTSRRARPPARCRRTCPPAATSGCAPSSRRGR